MKTFSCALLLGLFAVGMYNCTWTATPANSQPTTTAAAMPAADLVKRGEYLVTVMGCNDCHSPKIMTPQGPAPDPARLLSGHPADIPLAPIADKKSVREGKWVMMHPMVTAFVGPWGTSFAANLTPDDTGIGSWTYEQFRKALTEGKYKGLDGGRMLLPPMPWPNMIKMSDDDMRAVFAYLKSLPPIKNAVPAPIPPTELQ